jgi:hypothetical protein
MKYFLMQIYYTYKILHEMEQHYPNNGFNENKYNPVRSRTYPENLPVCGIFCKTERFLLIRYVKQRDFY